MTQSIQMSQTTNTGGGGGGLMQGLKRAVGGGGLFVTRYEGPGAITFAAKVPGLRTARGRLGTWRPFRPGPPASRTPRPAARQP